jgi:hypothetical protein
MVDEVPPPLQQDTLGHGGRKADPLYGIRRTCRSELNTSLISNISPARCETRCRGPDHEVTLAGRAIRSSATSTTPRRSGAGNSSTKYCVIPVLPDPGSRPLGPDTQTNGRRPAWPISERTALSNGPTEAINGVIETTRRIARNFRNFTNYRLRCLLAVGGCCVTPESPAVGVRGSGPNVLMDTVQAGSAVDPTLVICKFSHVVRAGATRPPRAHNDGPCRPGGGQALFQVSNA